MAEYYFIVNRRAGGGRCEKLFAQAETLLRGRAIRYRVAYTEYRRHAVELTREAIRSGAECVVAVGGDGTVNEVASVLQNTSVRMGLFPFGTGNDFARMLGISSEPEAALDVLLRDHVLPVDAGLVNDRFFINVAGLGFDVDVLERTDRFQQRYSGMTSYLFGIVQALAHLRPLRVKLRTDGREYEMDATLVAVGNGQYIGGGMRAVPNAKPTDGLFDVCLVERVGVLRFLSLLPGFIKGKHIKYNVTHCFQAREIEIASVPETKLQLDGEICLSTPVRFRLLPEAVRLLVP